MNPDEQNRILTGLIFLGVKAERLVDSGKSPEQQLHDALRLVQQAASESLLLETRPLIGARSHSTKEALLANALVQLIAATHANNLQLESAIIKQLDTLEARYAMKHDDGKNL